MADNRKATVESRLWETGITPSGGGHAGSGHGGSRGICIQESVELCNEY